MGIGRWGVPNTNNGSEDRPNPLLVEGRKIYVMGASGSGTTSLGALLSFHLSSAHHDTDEFCWLPSNPPYRYKRPIHKRLHLLRKSLSANPRNTISGSLDGWGDEIVPEFNLVIFVITPVEERLKRLFLRERQQYGLRTISPGGPMYEQHQAFMSWAARYDYATGEGRNRLRHEQWAHRLQCPVIRLDGSLPLFQQIQVLKAKFDFRFFKARDTGNAKAHSAH